MSEEQLVAGLTIAQRERMGLTRWNIRKVAKELYRNGELNGLNRTEMASLILDTIAVENVVEFQAVYNTLTIDWNALIEFIEKLLPLILQIIAIFS